MTCLPNLSFVAVVDLAKCLQKRLFPDGTGQTSRYVGHATNLLDDESFFDRDWRAENITFRERAVDGSPHGWPGGFVYAQALATRGSTLTTWPIVIG
jgi:hypothetical protein